MKGLRIVSLVAVALLVATIILMSSRATVQTPPYEGLGSPRMIAVSAVDEDGSFYHNQRWSLDTGVPGGLTCVWNATRNWYEITIPAVDYYYRDFPTVVTAAAHATWASYNSVNGKLIVQLTDPEGNPVQGAFSFMVLQCATGLD